ncbi:hypothetical protein B0H16DRAFT_1320731 [Mycena metata]|uniref:Uncharacterized protein n=1 Tax=Mycena metata TaxID=1033252 RepID=A0AAD7N561_9AGAR|nr:hypothetical protein B0H16DRAFT_1320731 [Mycena metata]
MPSSSKKIQKCKAVEVDATESKHNVTSSKRKSKVQPLRSTTDGGSRWPEREDPPWGLVWDAVNHSCGYDTTFTVFANIWRGNTLAWSHHFSTISPLMHLLSEELVKVQRGDIGF